MNCANFSVDIIDDDIFEKRVNETFILKIDESSLPSCVSVGDISQTLVTIMDNDCKYNVIYIYMCVCTYAPINNVYVETKIALLIFEPGAHWPATGVLLVFKPGARLVS